MNATDLVKRAREFRAIGLDGDHLVMMAAVLKLVTRKPGYLTAVTFRDVAVETSIPRETVRRKMNEMIDKKLLEWITRGVVPVNPAMWDDA